MSEQLTTDKNRIESFTFGDSVALDKESDVTQYFEAYFNGKWYELPFDMRGISRLFGSAVWLKSQLTVKRNILTSCLIKSPFISHTSFNRLVNDYLWTGNCYPERIDNRLGNLLEVRSTPSRYMRKGKDGAFFQISSDGWQAQAHEFKQGSILHLDEPDLNQEIYGVPDWLPAVFSAALNTESGKFRLRYYRNGSHTGYVMYVTDEEIHDDDIESIKTAMKQAKGPGNFRNMFVHSPGGDKDGLKIMPISEIAAKDEFFNIKNVTRDDILGACRVPVSLMGFVPGNNNKVEGSSSAAPVFSRNEIEPLQAVFEQINDWTGEEVISFKPYVIPSESAAP